MSFEDERQADPSAPASERPHDVALCDCFECENIRAAEATKPLVSCRCGVNFDDAAWRHAELVGYQPDGAGGLLEQRNCSCGSTHSIELDAGDARYPGALLSAIDRIAKASPGRKVSIHSDGAVVYVEVVGRSKVTCVGETLEDALQACVEACPPVTNPERQDALFALVGDREPLQSADRDTRSERLA